MCFLKAAIVFEAKRKQRLMIEKSPCPQDHTGDWDHRIWNTILGSAPKNVMPSGQGSTIFRKAKVCVVFGGSSCDKGVEADMSPALGWGVGRGRWVNGVTAESRASQVWTCRQTHPFFPTARETASLFLETEKRRPFVTVSSSAWLSRSIWDVGSYQNLLVFKLGVKC